MRVNNVIESIKARGSVRTFDGQIVDEKMKEKLISFGDTLLQDRDNSMK